MTKKSPEDLFAEGFKYLRAEHKKYDDTKCYKVIKENDFMAKDCFEKAAEAGYAPAMRELARCYIEGYGIMIKNKVTKGIKFLCQAVLAGDQNAMDYCLEREEYFTTLTDGDARTYLKSISDYYEEKVAKKEAMRKAKEEAERKAREEERLEREESARIAKIDAERKAKEEAKRKVKEQAIREAKIAERKAKEVAERKIKEEAGRKAEKLRQKQQTNQIAQMQKSLENERQARMDAKCKARQEHEIREQDRITKEIAQRRALQERDEEANRLREKNEKIWVKFNYEVVDHLFYSPFQLEDYDSLDKEEYLTLLSGGTNAIESYIKSNFSWKRAFTKSMDGHIQNVRMRKD